MRYLLTAAAMLCVASSASAASTLTASLTLRFATDFYIDEDAEYPSGGTTLNPPPLTFSSNLLGTGTASGSTSYSEGVYQPSQWYKETFKQWTVTATATAPDGENFAVARQDLGPNPDYWNHIGSITIDDIGGTGGYISAKADVQSSGKGEMYGLVQYSLMFVGVDDYTGYEHVSYLSYGAWTTNSQSLKYAELAVLGTYQVYLHNFHVNAAAFAVPEPATWAMLIAGFGMVGAAMRRRAVVLT